MEPGIRPYAGIEASGSERLRRLPSQVDVLIVGAGLSGKRLATALSPDISFALIDSHGPKSAKEAMYLVTKATADKWGIHPQERNRRNIITATRSYSLAGEPIVELKTSNKDDGFAATPQTAMERQVPVDPEKLFLETSCEGVNDDPSGGVLVNTNNGIVNAKIVIDATGWKGAVMHPYYGEENYYLAAIYGGTYQTEGFDPSALSMVRGFPLNNTNWVMPTGENGAEVAAVQILPSSRADAWHRDHAQTQLGQMAEWYKEHQDARVIFDRKQGHHMGFRLEPARRKYYKGRVVPFGEAAGLNSPSNGQLVDVLPHYAQTLADIITEASQENTWDAIGRNFYGKFISDPPYSYLVHSVMRDNVLYGRSRATKKVGEALRDMTSEDQIWSMINAGGIRGENMKRLVKRHPFKLAEFAVASIPSLASLLIRNPELYVQFIKNVS